MASKSAKEIVPITHRIRAVDLLLKGHSTTQAARVLKKELTLRDPTYFVEALYYPSRGVYAIPRYGSKEALLAARAKFEKMAVSHKTKGRIYGSSSRSSSAVESSKPRTALIPKPIVHSTPVPQPLKRTLPEPQKKLTPLELVKRALDSRGIKHEATYNKFVIPLQGNIRPLQDLMGQHNVTDGMYEVAVQRYLSALKIPWHKVTATWIDRQQVKTAKKRTKPAENPFSRQPQTQEAEVDDTDEEDETKTHVPEAPATITEEVSEIHVTLKKK